MLHICNLDKNQNLYLLPEQKKGMTRSGGKGEHASACPQLWDVLGVPWACEAVWGRVVDAPPPLET